MINLEQLGINQEQLMLILQQSLARMAPQPTVQLPLANPVTPTASPGGRQSLSTPGPATAPMPGIPELHLTMECDDGLIYIPDDDLGDL